MLEMDEFCWKRSVLLVLQLIILLFVAYNKKIIVIRYMTLLSVIHGLLIEANVLLMGITAFDAVIGIIPLYPEAGGSF